MSSWPEFFDLYRRSEHALKRAGFVQDRKKAHADWQAFASSLGEPFFKEVKASGQAAELIEHPPRVFMQGLEWEPKEPPPVKDVDELFAKGVCQVRHNYEHGEKLGSPRDKRLVAQAMWVLQLALQKSPEVQALLPKD